MSDLFQTLNDIANSRLLVVILYAAIVTMGVLYLALVIWTFKDARKRIEDPVIVGVAVLTSLVFPYIGTIVYALLRPVEYLADARERELEMQAMAADPWLYLCPNCEEPIRDDFVVCPNCREHLRAPCQHCGRPLDLAWRICPYCAREVRRTSRGHTAQEAHEGPEVADATEAAHGVG